MSKNCSGSVSEVFYNNSAEETADSPVEKPNKGDRTVASITNRTTDRQDKYLVSLISTWVASQFKYGCRTIITVCQSVLGNV